MNNRPFKKIATVEKKYISKLWCKLLNKRSS